MRVSSRIPIFLPKKSILSVRITFLLAEAAAEVVPLVAIAALDAAAADVIAVAEVVVAAVIVVPAVAPVVALVALAANKGFHARFSVHVH